MKHSRVVLLVVSSLLVLVVVGGGLAVRVGAADNPYRHVVRFSEVLSLVVENYVDPVDTDTLLQGAYEGMLNGLDSSGTYLTPAEVEEWTTKGVTDDADPGVLVIKSFGALQVVRVVPGSPAEVAGIVAGDQIRRLEGRPLRDVSLEQALRMLRGKPGTPVALGVLHIQEGLKREDVVVKRIKRSEPAFRIDVEKGAAVVTVLDLARLRESELSVALRESKTKGATRLFLDLRNVVEGTPREAVPLLSLFVSGDILRLKDRSGHVIETLSSPRQEAVWSGPIAVLVNNATAGGAEAVARLLQARRGAPVYGEATYGQAAEPKLFKLSNGSGLLLSAYLWEAPTGETWEGDGVKPDLVVTAEGREKDAAAGQLKRALDAFEKRIAANEPERKAA